MKKGDTKQPEKLINPALFFCLYLRADPAQHAASQHSGNFKPNFFQISKYYTEFWLHYSSSPKDGRAQNYRKKLNLCDWYTKKVPIMRTVPIIRILYVLLGQSLKFVKWNKGNVGGIFLLIAWRKILEKKCRP